MDSQLALINKKLDMIISHLGISEKSKYDISSDDEMSSVSSKSVTVGNTKKITINKNASKSIKKPKSEKAPIKKGTANIEIYDDVLLITGETYDRKELIKSFGGKWNTTHKGWTVLSSKLEDVRDNMEQYFENVSFNENNGCLIKKEPVSEKHSNGSCDIDSD